LLRAEHPAGRQPPRPHTPLHQALALPAPTNWIIYAEVEQGNVSDTVTSSAVHHRKAGIHY
jgi:hypothetical protein